MGNRGEGIWIPQEIWKLLGKGRDKLNIFEVNLDLFQQKECFLPEVKDISLEPLNQFPTNILLKNIANE